MYINNKAIGTVLIVVVLLAMTAGASALITRNNLENEDKVVTVSEKTVTTNKPVHHTANKVHWNSNRTAQQQPVPVKKSCSDGNVVGAVLGAVGGGLVGSQIGGGKGNDVATIGGAAVGGLAGQQYIPTNGVLCP